MNLLIKKNKNSKMIFMKLNKGQKLKSKYKQKNIKIK